MSETDIFERTKRLQEQCTTELRELIHPITERQATPVNLSSTYDQTSKLIQLSEGKIPLEAVVAFLTSGKADTVRIGFEIPSFEHRIGTVALRYEDGKITAEYDEVMQQLLNPN